MSEQDKERSRVKLQLDAMVREINREIINPQVPELKVKDLEPILKLVASSRAAYLKELFEVAGVAKSVNKADVGHFQQLKMHRETYEELLAASKALETAIERGYLDVQS